MLFTLGLGSSVSVVLLLISVHYVLLFTFNCLSVLKVFFGNLEGLAICNKKGQNISHLAIFREWLITLLHGILYVLVSGY